MAHLSSLVGKAPGNWEQEYDNVAIENEKHVYTIFDNRFYPTHQKIKCWLNKQGEQAFLWANDLNVTENFVLEEGQGCKEYLRKPKELKSLYNSPRKKCRTSYGGDWVLLMPYGKGAIVIIRYDYQDGIHVASKVSHFRDIAKIIETMHDSDFVHGDVRGFNMLHPHSEESLNGLKRSCLIDFDLARMNEKDKYSLGFSQTSPEILGDRIGKLGKCMKFQHDWVELGATMDEYQGKANDTGNSSQEGQ